MSSPSSSPSPDEESYYTAEEDDHSSAQASNVAESTVTTTPSESSDSLYTTAHQTPVASPSISRGIASSIPDTAQYQNSFEALRHIEESPEEPRERAPSTVTAAPRGPSFTHRAEASTYLEKQRALVMQQAKTGEPKIEMVEYGISVPMPDKEEDDPDSPTAKGLDEFSRLWQPRSAPRVNDGRPTSLADTLESNYIERRGASDLSYTYRPAPIDFDPQQQTFLPSSLPFNNTSSLVSNRTTDTHQGLAPIKENEMPYEYPSGKFIMNPEAPVFVPGQGGQPATKARNPRDWVYHGVPQPKPAQVLAAAPTNTPNIATLRPKVQLFGSGHGMFFDPNTGMFTGDGAPRKSPYRADGTLPSQPDLQSDFIANQQHPEPAEDKLHIQSKREVTKRMANFGKNGPIQTFRLGRPMPQGNQQGMRVMVEKEGEGEGSVPLGRRMHTPDEMEGDLARSATMTGGGEKEGVKEKDFGAEEGEGEGEGEGEEERKEFEGTVVRDFAISKGKGKYASSF